MADRKKLFSIMDNRSGRPSLVKFEQYSTFEKRCKEKFYYPLGTNIVFELEDGDRELDESAFACLDNMTKLKIRQKHEPTSSHPCDQKPDDEQEPQQKGPTGRHPCGQKPDDEQEPQQKERTGWTWLNPQNIPGAEYVRMQLEKGNIGQLKDILEEAEKMTVQPLAIAVIGSSGQGKSLLINALRDLHYSDDEGWAPVGETETTTECRAYQHPTYPNLVFWDVPGAGTKRFPREEYLSAIQYDRYDFYIICSSSRFTEDDNWLVDEVKRRHKKCYFLRTKVDQDIQNAKRTDRKFNEKKKVDEIRKDCQKNLSNEHKVFLINSFDKFQYDFPKFIQALIDDASNEQIRSLTLGLISVSVEMIKKKAAYFKETISITAGLSALGAFIPMPGASYAVASIIVKRKIQEYQRQFDLTGAHIMKCAESIGLSEEEFKMKCELKLDFEEIYSKGIMHLIDHRGPGMSKPELFRHASVIDSTIEPFKICVETSKILETILDGCKDDAVQMFTFVIERLYKLE